MHALHQQHISPCESTWCLLLLMAVLLWAGSGIAQLRAEEPLPPEGG